MFLNPNIFSNLNSNCSNLPRKAALAWQVSRYHWRPTWNFKIFLSRPLFIIILSQKWCQISVRIFCVLAGTKNIQWCHRPKMKRDPQHKCSLFFVLVRFLVKCFLFLLSDIMFRLWCMFYTIFIIYFLFWIHQRTLSFTAVLPKIFECVWAGCWSCKKITKIKRGTL